MPDYQPAKGRVLMPKADHQLYSSHHDENGNFLWPEARIEPPKCILCKQPAGPADKHKVFDKQVYAHALCIAELQKKYSQPSGSTGQETPMTQKSADNIMHKSFVAETTRKAQERYQQHLEMRRLAERAYNENRLLYGDAMRNAGIYW